MSHLEQLVIEVEEGTRHRAQVLPDGRLAYEAKITLTAEGYQRLKEGYLCGRCLEDLTPVGAFPEKCPCCGFKVRELQGLQLQRDFVGVETVGSQLSLSDELERMGELWRPS